MKEETKKIFNKLYEASGATSKEKFYKMIGLQSNSGRRYFNGEVSISYDKFCEFCDLADIKIEIILKPKESNEK